MSDDRYYRILQDTNDELEMEIQIAQEEIERLQEKMKLMTDILNEFETVCKGRASDPMDAVIRKWRRLKKHLNANEAK